LIFSAAICVKDFEAAGISCNLEDCNEVDSSPSYSIEDSYENVFNDVFNDVADVMPEEIFLRLLSPLTLVLSK
jgi:hypothetical protein